MKRSTTRWMTTFAAATVIALPVAGFAQTPPSAAPTTQSPQPAAAQSGAGQEAAKAHLTAARNTLSQLTQLPAAAQLQGDARTQVSQLISNFNELITTQSDWKAAYAKLEANLDALIGPPSTSTASLTEPARPTGTAGAVGTSGTASTIDPAVRAKLEEFRNHLDQFEKVALGSSEPAAATSSTTTTMTAPAAATATTTSTTTATEVTTTTPTAPTTSTSTTTATPASEAAAAPGNPSAPENEQLLRHVEAIEVILGAQAAAQAANVSAAGGVVTSTPTPSGSTRNTITSADVTLNKAQLEQLKTHLAEMRRLLEKK
jgi:hypothetical protein